MIQASEYETIQVTDTTMDDFRISPIPLYDSQAHFSKAFSGGKAFWLNRLYNAGFRVPSGYVIPTNFCFTRPKVNLSFLDYYPDNMLYAVRSGAPTSMPGLLETKLNVPKEGVLKAIHDVWDSWNSPNAVEYRKVHDIEETGTAVIIQQQIDAKYSGVAFTNDPTNTLDPHEFNPIIEYVEGLGDKLVGGDNSGVEAEGTEEWYSRLLDRLLAIHNRWGPSDVEWCTNEYGDLYILQRRELKFIEQVAEPEQNSDFGGRKLLATGKPIGMPVKVAASRVTSDCDSDENIHNSVIYIGSFRPEYYSKMLISKAILTKRGGATCHAAIVAREMGLPAISGILFEDFLRLENNTTYGLVVDGATGNIYEAYPEDLEILGKVEKQSIESKVPVRLPNLDISKFEWDANKLCYRFYKILNDYSEGTIDRYTRDKLVEEIAFVISSYYLIVTAAEARHAPNKCRFPEKYVNRLQNLGVALPCNNKVIPRSSFIEHGLLQPPTLQEAITILEELYKLYTEVYWTDSYGGPKWGAIVNETLKYLKGEVNAVLFVDNCFNLQHNGGRAFGKVDWFVSDESMLTEYLNAKAKSFKTLNTIIHAYHYTVTKTLEFGKLETILDPSLSKVSADVALTRRTWESIGSPGTCDCRECGCDACFEDGQCGVCRNCCGCEECGCSSCYPEGCGQCKQCCGCEECGCKLCYADEIDHECGDCEVCNPPEEVENTEE